MSRSTKVQSINDVSGKRILDLGCGLSPKGNICVDINQNVLEQIKREGRITIRHDLNKTPYPLDDDSIDEIYTSHLLEHLQIHVIDFFRECYRILKPEGVLHFAAPNAYHYRLRLSFLFGKHIPSYHPFHIKYLKPSYVFKLLWHMGFSVTMIDRSILEKIWRDVFAHEVKLKARKRP